jgi:hypothetical protein
MKIPRIAPIALVTAIALLTVPRAFSQDPPIEWGEIPRVDLEMKSYPPDPDAPAIILADYGVSQINSNFGVTFTRHTRIKILNEAGYDWGTHVISLHTKNSWEKLKKLEGVTYALRPDGTITETELEDEAVFAEKADETYTNQRFTMPALQPGCVIEFRYTIIQKDCISLPTWKFQSSIPTLWSEYRTIIPGGLAYARGTFSYERFFINESSSKTMQIPNPYTGEATSVCYISRWVMRDLAALHDEPFITTKNDHIPQVRFQLAEYARPGLAKIEKVLRTWEELIKELLDDKLFGKLLDADGDLRARTQTVIAGKSMPIDKMAALYDYLRLTLLWNGKYGLFGVDADDLLKSKKGDSGDINLLLIAMLRSAGLDADPVIVSTRSHGMITDLYPLVSQFNSVVARVRVGTTTFYLDATDPLRPYDLVAPELLNVAGLVIKEGPPEWVVVKSGKRYVHRTLARLQLTADGAAHGPMASADEDYSALLKRARLREKSPLDIAKDIFDAEPSGLAFDSVTVIGRDSIEGQLHVEALATAKSYAQVAGNFIYFNPIVLDRLRSSPFKLKERKFPVDMSYGRDVINLATIHIPPDYEIKEFPKNIELGGDDIKYTRRTIAWADSVQTMTHLTISVTVFPPEVYESLKGFYDQIVAAESEQIVLERKPPPAAPQPAATPKTPKKGKKK